MLRGKFHIHAISRLMTGLFAVQLFAAGFCMMMPDVHAMPMATTSQQASMDHCATAVETVVQDSPAEQSACSHCNAPDQLLQPLQVSVDADLLFIAYVTLQLNEIPVTDPALELFVRPATGPPTSGSILYETTQRILI